MNERHLSTLRAVASGCPFYRALTGITPERARTILATITTEEG